MSDVLLSWALPFAVGTVTGILSGFGVGGGTLLLVWLSAVVGVEQHQAQGINLLYFLPAAALAIPKHWKNEYIERGALLPSITAGLVCAAGAAWLSTGISTGSLRRIFGIFLILMGVIQLKSTGNVLKEK